MACWMRFGILCCVCFDINKNCKCCPVALFILVRLELPGFSEFSIVIHVVFSFYEQNECQISSGILVFGVNFVSPIFQVIPFAVINSLTVLFVIFSQISYIKGAEVERPTRSQFAPVWDF